jgi:hypothetical protein
MGNGIVPESEVVIINADSTCGLAPEKDPSWISSERRDVVCHPFQSHALVEDPNVRACTTGSIWKTENIDAIVDGDNDMFLAPVYPSSRDLTRYVNAPCREMSTSHKKRDWQF